MSHIPESQEDEDTYLDPGEVAQTVAGNLTNNNPLTQYDSETLDHLKSLSESEVANEIIAAIEAAPLFKAVQQALIAVVRTNLTKSTILANVTNREYAIICIDIALNEADISATRHDMRRPELLQIKDMITTSYDMLLTRARGEHRERMLQNSTRVEVFAGRASSDQQQPTQDKPRSWRRRI